MSSVRKWKESFLIWPFLVSQVVLAPQWCLIKMGMPLGGMISSNTRQQTPPTLGIVSLVSGQMNFSSTWVLIVSLFPWYDNNWDINLVKQMFAFWLFMDIQRELAICSRLHEDAHPSTNTTIMMVMMTTIVCIGFGWGDACMWKSAENLEESALSVYHVSFWDQAQVFNNGSKRLYLLSHKRACHWIFILVFNSVTTFLESESYS